MSLKLTSNNSSFNQISDYSSFKNNVIAYKIACLETNTLNFTDILYLLEKETKEISLYTHNFISMFNSYKNIKPKI